MKKKKQAQKKHLFLKAAEIHILVARSESAIPGCRDPYFGGPSECAIPGNRRLLEEIVSNSTNNAFGRQNELLDDPLRRDTFIKHLYHVTSGWGFGGKGFWVPRLMLGDRRGWELCIRLENGRPFPKARDSTFEIADVSCPASEIMKVAKGMKRGRGSGRGGVEVRNFDLG
ncbi:hypothetical protein CDAR_561691 [Caerostris darwini]|uniref:Uncharacterized protein n=1 Tax=Caerostris darwini TaxID=1538125 RepID=A0AAV4MII3_9ARAC|nr:hypothetical protein CDAR_561691 [Caerostris darwini]